MANVKSVMIVGVGGQGSLLASKLLGNVLLSRGFDVKVSEVHGMSQRGRFRRHLCALRRQGLFPIVSEGEADAGRLL